MSGAKGITLTSAELEAMLERVGEAAAKKALAGVGLHDEHAARDVRDLRDLIESWRDARREVRRTVVKLMTTALLVAMATGAALTWWRQ